MVLTRNALLGDVARVFAILEPYARAGILLARSTAELSENVRDFVVAEKDGEIIGCGALHLYGRHLAEIRSIAVSPPSVGWGAGRALVEALLSESRRHGVTCVCLFTRTPEFFAHLGFARARREQLPDKIYKDCAHCPKLTCCDEIAMFMGTLPSHGPALSDPEILVPLLARHPR